VRTLRETVKTSETTKTELVRQGEELKDIKGSAERADTSVTEAYENTRKIDKYSHFFPFFKSSGKKKRKEDKEFKEKQKEIEKAPNRVRYCMNGFVIAIGSYVKELNKEAIAIGKKIGSVEVDMSGTSCKVPFAPDYIKKIMDSGNLGKKRKTAKC
jgi:hypothetical protein